MEFKIPGIKFIQSSISLDFNTDGVVKSFLPAVSSQNQLDTIFILSDLHYEIFKIKTISKIRSFEYVSLPENLPFPVLYNGTQDLSGKKVLMFMLTGWGDTILIEPVLRAFYHHFANGLKPLEITIAGNWIKNFPYRNSSYIKDLVPNILSLNELLKYDVIINFIPAHFERINSCSLQRLYADYAHIKLEGDDAKIPVIHPDQKKAEEFLSVFDKIRSETGKKILCVNWLSRFHHKNASASLFAEIIAHLPDYQAVAFNDQLNSSIIDKAIGEMTVPLLNLSRYISDYHDTIAALSLVDAFISVDTGIVHAAGALRIPGVALFGPFPPETLIFCYPSVLGLQATFPIGLCREACLETHRGCIQVDYSNDIISPCFQSITSSDVLTAFKSATIKNTASASSSGEIRCVY